MIYKPVILDFDQSVGNIPNALHLPLTDWQEQIRFGCSWKQFDALEQALENKLPVQMGTVLMGSGDYHHVSLLLLKHRNRHLPAKKFIDVIIFDNHPDNMRYLFGIHCGSWVSFAASLPFVRKVHVVGITSNDIAFSHAWENRLAPLWKKKLTYWSLGVNVSWARKLGLEHAFLSFDTANALIRHFIESQRGDNTSVYLSIDKDVLCEDVVQTNWDQGQLRLEHLFLAISGLKNRIIGSDITGEISFYQYRHFFKRFLSAFDNQASIQPEKLEEQQALQHRVNLQLIDAIQKSRKEDY